MTDIMTNVNKIKKNKSISSMEDYINSISNNCEKNMIIQKSPCKISNENIIIPTILNYKDITNYNYNSTQLKVFAKHYKLKVSGNKKELQNRIFSFLHLSFYIIKIQKIFRGFITRKYNSLHGPAYKNRTLCTNTNDFVTMEPLEEININQFISYKDVDGFIYGFDMNSLYNMVIKHKETKNPYNRINIPNNVLKDIKSLVRISKLLNINLNLAIDDDTQNISSEKAIELRTLSLFQTIDSLGNYSNPQWFLSLNRNNIIKFMRELLDIWSYRVQLSIEVKRNICPPNGDPFMNLNIYYLQTEQNMNNVRKVVLEVLEKLVNSGIDRDSKSLGAYYVLGSLTLVNNSAASALPWLYQSFCYF
jgi:hypothetical protein